MIKAKDVRKDDKVTDVELVIDGKVVSRQQIRDGKVTDYPIRKDDK